MRQSAAQAVSDRPGANDPIFLALTVILLYILIIDMFEKGTSPFVRDNDRYICGDIDRPG